VHDGIQARPAKHGEFQPLIWGVYDLLYRLTVALETKGVSVAPATAEILQRTAHLVMLHNVILGDWPTPGDLFRMIFGFCCSSGDLKQPVVQRASIYMGRWRMPKARGCWDAFDMGYLFLRNQRTECNLPRVRKLVVRKGVLTNGLIMGPMVNLVAVSICLCKIQLTERMPSAPITRSNGPSVVRSVNRSKIPPFIVGSRLDNRFPSWTRCSGSLLKSACCSLYLSIRARGGPCSVSGKGRLGQRFCRCC
jgi:hypothetical protein